MEREMEREREIKRWFQKESKNEVELGAGRDGERETEIET